MPSGGRRDDEPASVWTAAERHRMRNRFRAALAGLMELEVLRSRHSGRVATALGKERPRAGSTDRTAGCPVDTSPCCYQCCVLEGGARVRLARSLSQETLSDSTGPGRAWIWSSRSLEDLLLPYHHQQCRYSPQGALPPRANLGQADSRSSASSGFCDDDDGDDREDEERGEAVRLCVSWFSLQRWGQVSSPAPGTEDVIPMSGLLAVTDLCPRSHWEHLSTILQMQVMLDPQYQSDLVCSQSSEVYRYPSPLHAVALQSPLYALPQSSGDTFVQSRGPSMQESAIRERHLNPSNCSACRLKSCSLPAFLSKGPRGFGWSTVACPERCRLDQVILRLASRHWRLGANQGRVPDQQSVAMVRNASVCSCW